MSTRTRETELAFQQMTEHLQQKTNLCKLKIKTLYYCNEHSRTTKWGGKKRKIILNIFGPNYENGKWKLNSNKEIYEWIQQLERQWGKTDNILRTLKKNGRQQ